MARMSSHPQERRPEEDHQAEVSLVVETLEDDPTRRGYTPIPNYFKYFWTPLLGLTAAAVYELLCSFAHGRKVDCHPSVGLLADILGIDRHTLTGRTRRTRHSGQVVDAYHEGVFARLAQFGLCQLRREERHGVPQYRFSVRKTPPLLTPDQVAQLPARLQRKHAELLARCAADRARGARPRDQPGAHATGGCAPAIEACAMGTGHLNTTQRTRQPNTLSVPPRNTRAPVRASVPAVRPPSATPTQSRAAVATAGEVGTATPPPPIAPHALAELVTVFYTDLGQPRISRQKCEKGVQLLRDLARQGFTEPELRAGMQWIVRHRPQLGGHVYSLRLLPDIIGQALQEAAQRHTAAEHYRRQRTVAQEVQAAEARRTRLATRYHALPPAEQAALRQRAVAQLLRQGIKPPFLLESLITAESCRLLEERLTAAPRAPAREARGSGVWTGTG